MQSTYELRDDQWEAIPDEAEKIIDDLLRQCFGLAAMAEVGGGRWRSLPAEFGKWNSVFQRFRACSKDSGTGLKTVCSKCPIPFDFNTLAVEADIKWFMIDSTIIRAHQHAAGAKRGNKIRH